MIIIKNNISGIFNALNNSNTTANLQKQLASEQKKNEYLKQRLFYVKTNQFIEDQAQNKLGLLKTGEYFVIAPTPAPTDIKSVVVDVRPNWQKWWQLFF